MPGKNLYRVTSQRKDGTRRIHSKGTTLSRAKKQVKLLNAVDHGWVPS